MVNKILIDTNVLIDYLLEREPFFEDAKEVILSCADGKVRGCIAAHSIPNMFFIFKGRITVQRNVERYYLIYAQFLMLRELIRLNY